MSETMERPAAALDDELWTVVDTNAKAGPRMHEFEGGYQYSLEAFKRTPVPKRHALQFLKDEAFVVRRPDGQVVRSIPKAEVDGSGAPKLEAGQTIAYFEELTDEALDKRVALRPTGHEYADAPRALKIQFLTEAPRKAELPRHLRSRDTSTPENDEVMPDDDAKRLLEGGGDPVASLLAGRA